MTTRQEFKVTDMVRLEVQEGWPDLPNLVLNPSGEGGAWAWYCWKYYRLQGLGDRLRLSTTRTDISTSPTTSYGVPLAQPAAPGALQARASVRLVSTHGTINPTLSVAFDDAAGSTIGIAGVALDAGPGSYAIPPTDVPAGTVRVRASVGGVGASSPGDYIDVADVVLMVGAPADVAASDPLSDPPWVDVLGSTHSIDTERDELDAGFLNATIYDSSLDPATVDLIRPGKRCRLLVSVDGVWEPIFTGLLDNPSSAYLVKDPAIPGHKRVQVQLVANDPVAVLAGAKRPDGVATIAELPAVLLGTGLPWCVNGSTDAIDPETVTVVAVNDSATALDQVAITRDSVRGYAWLDRAGVVQAWDADQIPTAVAAVLDEDDYSDLSADFDVARLINSVVVKLVRINAGTGDTEEIELGPYQDPASIREWRERRAEFRVQGLTEGDVPGFAAAVLAANAVPGKRINEVTLPLRAVSEVEEKALLDLYDLVETSCDRAGISGQQARVTSVKHRLEATGDRGRWSMTVGFSTDGSVAVPRVTPAPGTRGKTLAQLLRPVGEVTGWYGAKADCPAGWLVLDGTSFDPVTYPDLAALLGGSTLPDMTDRMPVGAGTKALGTFGGSPTHTHAKGASITTAQGAPGPYVIGDGDDVQPGDSLPPWRAVWFIIRAA